ncbi:MAG: hypothetical protein A2498_11070 [Lentisphaerae bacterium RIFOXYC12_FULL_60_16]|nr:MAG: hypothetical protein A2498_11070 [Lentisphaerae bacterium RIFOXYC12_FULL_60_16]OGV76215.1 MAG: hypothetical protein A2340_00145 [Lentisphaerae bacterium RIFOXYB12_FULL_60_10]
MKGIILSVACLIAFLPCAMFASRLLNVTRHARLFFKLLLVISLAYVVTFLALPSDLGYLPDSLVSHYTTMDGLLGYIMLWLNFHSFLTTFYGINGGFSMCLLYEIYRSGPQGLSTESLAHKFQTADGTDKIHAWRLPRLIETGYIAQDPGHSLYTLTAKGAWVARLTLWLHRIFAMRKKGG